jgi:hypothetical protein
MQEIRRLDLRWEGDEVAYFDSIKAIAQQNNIELPDFIKKILREIANL